MNPTIDAHAHLDPSFRPDELTSSGAVLSMCLSLEKSEIAMERRDPQVAWGVGCYFSIHSAVARHSKFRLHVPPERILVESDHGFHDPPAAIPCRVEWVEYLVAQQYGLDVKEIRRLCWSNLSRIIQQTRTNSMLPEKMASYLRLSSNPVWIQGESHAHPVRTASSRNPA